MSSSDSSRGAAPRRSPFARRGPQEGPRATFGQLLPYLFEHKKVLYFVIGLSILGAAASLAQPLLVSQVIAVVGDGGGLGGLVWALIALVVVSSIISGYQHYLLQRTGEGVVLSSRRRLVARMLHLPISEFDTRRTGDLVSRVGSDTTLLRAVLTQGLVEAIGGSLTFVGALIAMLIIDPVLLGLTVLVIAVSIVVVTVLSGRIRQASARAQAKVGDLAAAVERAISSVRTVRASNATEREIASVDKDAKGAYDMGIDVAKISALVVPVAGVAMQVSFLVVLGVGGYRVASGAITVANLVAFILFLFMMIMPLGQAFGAISATNQALGALGRIQEIIDLPTENANDEAIARTVADPGAWNHEAPAIEFVDVTFRYSPAAIPPGSDESAGLVEGEGASAGGTPARPAVAAETESAAVAQAFAGVDTVARDEVHAAETVAAEASARAGVAQNADGAAVAAPAASTDSTDAAAPADSTELSGTVYPEATKRVAGDAILRGISFQVPRGKRTALVGPSGAGKSTVLGLIERFYDPESGSVRMGGVDIRTLERTALRGQLGYVEQDAPVLAGTLRDNLLLASPNATDEACVHVLRSVNLGDVLDRDPAGLDALVGEDGIMLSGGERQRLAIARALLSAPPILLLDESTSSLDGANEQMMREAIDAVSEDRTMIVIAHRLSTVVDSDQIVVIDQGRVVGIGTHSELVQTTPLYRNLAKHQLLV